MLRNRISPFDYHHLRYHHLAPYRFSSWKSKISKNLGQNQTDRYYWPEIFVIGITKRIVYHVSSVWKTVWPLLISKGRPTKLRVKTDRLEPRATINLRVADRILENFPSIISFNKFFNLQGKMDTFKPVLPFQILTARKDLESSSI